MYELRTVYTIVYLIKKGLFMSPSSINIQCYGSNLIKRVIQYNRKKTYKISLLSRNPISSALTSPLLLKSEDIENLHLSESIANSLVIEFNKKALDIIDESNADYLLIDLMNEVEDRFIITSGTVKSEFSDYHNDDLVKTVRGLYPDCKLSSRKCYEISDNEISNIFNSVCSFLKKRFEQNKIIIIECYLAEQYPDNYINLQNYPNLPVIKKTNEYLKKCYNVISKSLPKCSFIKFPAWGWGSINTVDGINPLVLDSSYYNYLSQAIDVATGNNPFYTLQNLYDEQSLNNRLRERARHSNMVWELNEKIKQLEKEIENLKSERNN